MIPNQEQQILRKALGYYGLPAQRDKMIEEMSELTTEILHERLDRPANVIGELADVSIVLDQLILAYGEDDVRIVRDAKLRKLADLVGAEGE